jgi:hypothetical protein
MPDWPAKRRSRSAETPGRFFAQILGRLTQALLFSKVSSTFTIIGLRRRLCGCSLLLRCGRRIAAAERSTVRGLVGKDVLLTPVPSEFDAEFEFHLEKIQRPISAVRFVLLAPARPRRQG